jgi:hypothetical protein
MDPTFLVSALNNVKKIVDYGFQLKSASAESREAAATLKMVSRDLNELKRLFVQLEDILEPQHQENIRAIICRTNEVIALMAAPNQRSRRDVKRFQTVTIYRRITWTLRDGDEIKKHVPDLAMCQNSLNTNTVRLDNMRLRHALAPPDSGSCDLGAISTLDPGECFSSQNSTGVS